jgi:hexulose-6-phosphate isomerase
MSRPCSRRDFLATSALALGTGVAAPARLPVAKAVYIGMLPKTLSYAGRFKLARDTGFDQVECETTSSQKEVEEIKRAAELAGIRIHSVMNQAHWRYPLSSSDPAEVAKSIEGMETSLRNASFWGADTVLLVPAVVNPGTRYRDAWTRSQQQIRALLPLAQELKVIIALENVWNKFLLSPLEFARYLDDFASPWVRAYFDVGNILLYGYPQDWIRTLGKRIVKLHLKDFRMVNSTYEWVALREGNIDWPEVYRALSEIGYSGTATCELPAGDEAYLREVSRRVDLILTGA